MGGLRPQSTYMMYLRDYFRVLVPLLVAFAAYHVAVVPFLEPKSDKQGRKYEGTTLPPREDWWEDFFLEGDWQRDKKTPPRVVKTDTATLLFQTREQKSETRWLVKPLTILIPQRDSGTAKQAILIKNEEGAEIEFKTAVDWTQELPPVVSGQLLGEITIYSPPDDAFKNNGMLINARGLFINKRQIWTNEKIKLQLGNSIVEGRYLQIFLDKDLLTAEQSNGRNKSPFNGLDSLELTYVERVHIDLEPGGLWPRKDIPDISKRAAHATLNCGGSFKFQFHQSQATLKRGVHMEHRVEGLPVDTFDCEELNMFVGWKGKQTPEPSARTNTSGSNWTVERLVALGAAGKDNRDHSGWLKLIAPGMQAEALGQHLEMDMLNGIVTLSNRLPGATAREMTPVYLRRESVQVWSPEVQYQSADALANSSDGPSRSIEPINRNRLGALLAQGAGRAQMDSNEDSWKLSWGERLIVRPDPNDLSKDVVDIKGSANISCTTHGRFRAEQLYLWLTPVSPELAAKLASQYPDGKVPQALPDRMEADGRVDVNSPILRATVEKMQVWFAYQQPIAAISPQPPQSTLVETSDTRNGPSPLIGNYPLTGLAAMPTSQASTPNQNSVPGALSLLPSTGMAVPPLKQPVSPSNPSVKNGFLTANPASPLIVTAKTMRAKVLRSGSQNRVEDLILEGRFELTKNQLSDESPWPFTITGDQLQLSQLQNDTSDITIVGQPAKVTVGSGWVVAPELKLKQSQSQFWIDHPGELVIPVEALQKSLATPTSNTNLVSLPSTLSSSLPGNGLSPWRPTPKESGNSIRWHMLPRLQWGKRMTFDGRTARFGGGVTLNCRMETDPKTLWHIEASSNQMLVVMDPPVALRNANNTTPLPQSQIAMIRLEDNVDIQAVQTDLDSKRRSIEHMKLPQLDIMVASQTWLGHGPGELWSRRLGNDNPIGGVSRSANPSNPAIADQFAENVKQCIHLSFIGRMEGNMVRRSATFYERIEALIGPIASWDDALNVHTVDRLGRNQSLLFSDQLDIFDASGLSWNQSPDRNLGAANNAAWEIEASGRVQMQSSTETGVVNVLANALKYAAISDTVRVEGSQQQPARINKSQINTPPIDIQVKSAAIRLKTGEMDLQGISIEGTLPQNLQPANAPTGPLKSSPAGPGASRNLPSPRDMPMKPPGRNGS